MSSSSRAPVRELAPPPRLRPTVEAVWVADAAGGPPRTHRVLPDGCCDLIWRHDDGPEGGGTLFVTGPDLHPRPAALGPGFGFVGARFRLGEARRVLGLDPADLVGRGPVPAVAAAAGLAALERRLLGVGPRSPDALASLLCEGIASLAGATADPSPPRLRAALSLLGPAESPPEVAAVARALGVSPRTLHRELVAWTGLPPRLLARVLRFRRALRLLRRPGGRRGAGTLADAAAAAGYADQAHMAREFREFAGAPPSAFDAARVRSVQGKAPRTRRG